MRLLLVIALLGLVSCGEPDTTPSPTQTRDADARVDARVVAVVRSTGWLDQMARKAGQPIYIHHEPLAADLVVVYARLRDASVDYLTRAQADAFEADAKARRRRAADTLSRMLPDLDRDEVAQGVYALQGDSTYVPSVLLMDGIWGGQAATVKGDLVAVVPTRHTVLFTGSKNPAGIRRMREIAAKAAAEAEYPISEMLVRRWGGAWIPHE